jgi:hypothetical protein
LLVFDKHHAVVLCLPCPGRLSAGAEDDNLDDTDFNNKWVNDFNRHLAAE